MRRRVRSGWLMSACSSRRAETQNVGQTDMSPVQVLLRATITNSSTESALSHILQPISDPRGLQSCRIALAERVTAMNARPKWLSLTELAGCPGQKPTNAARNCGGPAEMGSNPTEGRSFQTGRRAGQEPCYSPRQEATTKLPSVSSTAMTNGNWTLHEIGVPAANTCHSPSKKKMESAGVEPQRTYGCLQDPNPCRKHRELPHSKRLRMVSRCMMALRKPAAPCSHLNSRLQAAVGDCIACMTDLN